MNCTRRHALAAFGLLHVAGALGIGGAAWRWWDRPPGAGRQVLSTDEYDTAQALAEAWMPPGGTPPLSGRDADLGAFFDDVLAGADPTTRKLMKALLQILDDATLPTHGSAFRTLGLEARTDALHGWLISSNGALRSASQGVIALMSMGWTTHPDVAAILQPMFGCGYGR